MGGAPGVCEALTLVSCFYCNGTVFSTEDILPNLGGGGSTEVWLLDFAAMK